MGVYLRGNAVTIVQRFYVVDPLTEVATLADPTTVLFSVLFPDGTEATYEAGVAPEVTHPSVGVYLLALGAPLPPGDFAYRCDGTGAVVAAGEGTFTILSSGILAQDDVAGPKLGPCSSWISGEDVANYGGPSGITAEALDLDPYAYEASAALYEISGRTFTGRCGPTLVRPNSDKCRCWAPSSLGPFWWSSGAWGVGTWGWGNEFGDRLGCQPLSLVKLAGYPIREIVEVKIDGVVLDPLDSNGNPNYRLDRWRELVRMGDPGPPAHQRFWPACQRMDLDDTQPGTFSISYYWGIDPPQLGKDAAAALAWQLYLSGSGQKCVLPQGTTRVQRQGITIERGFLANWFDPTKPTGIVPLDLFLRAYWQTRTARRSAVWSPDVDGFPRRMT